MLQKKYFPKRHYETSIENWETIKLMIYFFFKCNSIDYFHIYVNDRRYPRQTPLVLLSLKNTNTLSLKVPDFIKHITVYFSFVPKNGIIFSADMTIKLKYELIFNNFKTVNCPRHESPCKERRFLKNLETSNWLNVYKMKN